MYKKFVLDSCKIIKTTSITLTFHCKWLDLIDYASKNEFRCLVFTTYLTPPYISPRALMYPKLLFCGYTVMILV